MREPFLIFCALFMVIAAQAQFTYKIKADSLLVTNDSCSAEFNLENSTKSVKGFLFNKGNGRTEFKQGLIKYDDSTYFIGADTLKIKSQLFADKHFGNADLSATGNRLHDFNNNNLTIDSVGNFAILGRGGSNPPSILTQVGFQSGGGAFVRIKAGTLAGRRAELRAYGYPGGADSLNPFVHIFSIDNSFSTSDLKIYGDSIFMGTHKLIISGLLPQTASSSDSVLVVTSAGQVVPRSQNTITSNNWSLFGNSATSAGTNFLGTTDAQRLVFKTNNTEQATISSAGNLGIGTASPAEKLHVNNGKLRITGTYNIPYNDGALLIVDSSTGVSQSTIAYFKTPNLSDNSRLTLQWGKASTSANSAFLGFSKFTDGSTSNYIELQISGFANLLKVHANRNVEIGKGNTATPLADDGYRLNVLKADGSITTEGRVINSSTQGSTFNTTSSALSSYAGYFNSNGTRISGSNSLTNVGMYATASGAQNNYAAVFDAGEVGIGTSSPAYKLDVNGTARVSTLPFLTHRDTVLTYDPVTKQLAATNTYAVKMLPSDVTNNNATLNTIADVTGLSFPVTSGVTYRFKFFIVYTAAATGTGSRWTINGPSTTFLHYRGEWPASVSLNTQSLGAAAYNLPANCNTGSASTGSNIAIIQGVIKPSANGTVIARFASGVASSAIVAKGGMSYVEFEVIN